MKNKTSMRFGLLCLVASLTACGGSSSDDPIVSECSETGPYPCQTGSTEPLYTFQWALNYADSYFKSFPETFGGGLDLNVEPVHRQGIKGQGVNVLVLDTGSDLHNEDLSPNADFSMSWNFRTNNNDPYPDLSDPNADAHGTLVAGMIGAAQNEKGVMGIAPRVNLGAANYLSGQDRIIQAYGGAPWSSKAHVFNASYGGDRGAPPYESSTVLGRTLVLRGLKNLRDGKGAIFVKSAGNSFDPGLCGKSVAYFDCTSPSNDTHTLESNVITVAALNARGSASSYSSAGAVVWVTGMGGEYGGHGIYGEGRGPRTEPDGPVIYGTDLRGCIEGYSQTDAETPFLRGQTVRDGKPDNLNCDYAYMNGTSAAAPTISGVVALILSANPDLSWRDVRDILRSSARKVDADYTQHIPAGGDKPFGALLDLKTNQPTPVMGRPQDIVDGATAFPMDLGWQRNAAGYEHSNWYGFGVPDAHKAVSLALEYKANPSLGRTEDVKIPAFRSVALWKLDPLEEDDLDDTMPDTQVRIGPFPYQRITSLGRFQWDAQTVDQLQVRLSGEDVCLGSLGLAARSPSGTVSLLKLPNDHFKADGWDWFEDYTSGSFAFYGEPAQGSWELFAIAANPDTRITVVELIDNQRRERLSEPCPSLNQDGSDRDFFLHVEARIVAQ